MSNLQVLMKKRKIRNLRPISRKPPVSQTLVSKEVALLQVEAKERMGLHLHQASFHQAELILASRSLTISSQAKLIRDSFN